MFPSYRNQSVDLQSNSISYGFYITGTLAVEGLIVSWFVTSCILNTDWMEKKQLDVSVSQSFLQTSNKLLVKEIRILKIFYVLVPP